MCTADGLPSPTYDWTQNGVELSDRNKYQMNEDGSELTILSITKHERDYYNCTATNQKGFDATAVFIDVYYEPQTGWPLCEVHVENNERYIAEGDFVELTCKATGGNPPPHLEWYNNSEPLPECTSTTEDNDVVTETVSCWILTPYDNGKMYDCKGNHDATEENPSCTEILDVKYSPTWQICSNTAGDQFDEDDYFTLTCESDGNPLATLQWINGTDAAILHETNDYDEDETAINEYSWDLSRGDNQVFFEYHAFNDIRENTLECRTAHLIVHFAPLSVSLSGYTDTARKGDRLELSCVTDSSNPVSTISWYKNDQLITDDDHEEIQEEDVRDGSFHGKVTEGGLHFDVLASHNENEFSFPPSEPEGCTTSLTGYSSPVVEGDDLVLTCTSCSGNPTPIIEWFKDEHKIEIGLGDISISQGENHGKIAVQDLTLHLTYQHHGQRLTCECFNEEFMMENDRAVSNNIILDVQYAPFVENEEENQQQSVNLTDDAELLCEINSNPEVEITWFDVDNETISNSTGKFLVRKNTTNAITTGVLTIFNVSESDLGYYRCQASNDINGVNLIINLWGKRSPYPAYSVIVTDKTEHSLTLEWVPGFDGGLPQQFQLEYRESDTMKGALKRTNPTTNTSDTIHELQAMTEYHITVVSFNSIGESHSDPPTVNSTLRK
ncbi:nephrin-like [Ptychodera flava]|uniref:nephrin-like n=1 Tax=Ptychodera flava TaxID=63121 RepID=UPI003969D177